LAARHCIGEPQAYFADILDRIYDHKINRLYKAPVELGADDHAEQSSRINRSLNGAVTLIALGCFFLCPDGVRLERKPQAPAPFS